MKAEKYIEDFTRRCSNEMVAEGWKNGEPCYHPWMTVDGCKEAVRLARQETIDALWHDAEKEMPKDGAKVLILSSGSNLYLCDVRNGHVVGADRRGYLWDYEMRYWLDTDDLFDKKDQK